MHCDRDVMDDDGFDHDFNQRNVNLATTRAARIMPVAKTQ